MPATSCTSTAVRPDPPPPDDDPPPPPPPPPQPAIATTAPSTAHHPMILAERVLMSVSSPVCRRPCRATLLALGRTTGGPEDDAIEHTRAASDAVAARRVF